MARAWRASVSFKIAALQIRNFKRFVTSFREEATHHILSNNTFVHHVGVGLSNQFLGQDLERI
jgi:hypothetical protein